MILAINGDNLYEIKEIDDINFDQSDNTIEMPDCESEKNEKLENETKNKPHKKKYIRKYKNATCDICNKTFTRVHTYRNHMQLQHSIIKSSYNCSKCPKTFTTEKKFLFHLKTHLLKSEINSCSSCGDQDDEQKFQCEECGKKFETINALKDHKRFHKADRSFVCSYCPTTFKIYENLKVELIL